MAPRQRSPSRVSSSDESDAIPLSSSAEVSPLIGGGRGEKKSVVGGDRDERAPPPTAAVARRPQSEAGGTGEAETRSGGDRGGICVRDRDRHDLFNLVALPSVIALTVANYDWTMLFRGMGAVRSWTDEYFMPYWSVSMLYFFADLIWVQQVPTCVKNPGLIIKHHVVAMMYLIGPVFYPEYRWAMGACLSVEVNTWFLIARRVAYLRRDTIPNVVTEVITFLFYLSWVIIRCIVYPYILVLYVRIALEVLEDTGTLLHPEAVFVPIHAALCCLNIKWTYDLFSPIIVSWVRKEGGKGGVSDGL